MATANTIALLFNGLTLALALGLLILVLWQDPNNEANRYFALFLLMVVVWASGSLLGRSAAYVNAGASTIQTGLRLLDVGFTGASISVYVYSAVITGARGRWFRRLALAALVIVLAYQLALALIVDTPRVYEVDDDGILSYGFDVPSVVFYLSLQLSTIALVWRNRLKIHADALVLGILSFSVGQMLGLLSPRFRILGFAEDVSAVSALMMSYAVVRQQIMGPLLGRAKQLEAVRDVGLAITRNLRLQETLATIATQAAELLRADGAAIFLKRDGVFELAAVHNLPELFVGQQVALGQGVVGTVALERRGRRVDSYHRDWHGSVDLPLARETFGAVVCVPLLFAAEVVGVLLVIQGRTGRLFNRDDMHLLELLGPQAAVAITNSRLFEAERDLSGDLRTAKNQLETVLTSTQNPVIAIDRQFRIIFANPAAASLLDANIDPVGWLLVDFVPSQYLPPNLRGAMRGLHRQDVYVYEIAVQGRTYFCHVAQLGKKRTEGWVVVLNDVTQLKELDRLKSQMVRMTSHDLKNPLQAAMSYLELLAEDGETVFTVDMQEYVDNVWAQLTRMFRIISGILDLERVQAGTPAFELCAVDTVIQRVVDEFVSQARSKDVTLETKVVPALPFVLGDPHQLGQALANLVENAIKFTPSGGNIVVKAEANEKWVVIHVIDTGIGIPLDEQGRIFERFYRAQHQSMVHVSGSGLGLSLVKAIVDSHQGEIDLNSVPGKGTTFHVRLPVAEEIML